METLKPLIDQLSILIAKAGGNADQVWGSLIDNFWFESLIGLVTVSTVACVFAYMGLLSYMCGSREKKDTNDEGGFYALALALVVFALIVFGIGLYENLPGVIHPEGGLIRSFR